MQVDEITEYDADILETLIKLLPQLSKNAALPSTDLVRRIIESEATRISVALKADGKE